MGAIVVGLRPGDDKKLRQPAEAEGRRVQDLAGIYLERAIRRAGSTDLRHDAVLREIYDLSRRIIELLEEYDIELSAPAAGL